MRIFLAALLCIGLCACAHRFESQDMSPSYGAALAHQLRHIGGAP